MDIDKVYIPLLPQGHKVKFKVTKVIAGFLPILLGFHLLGVLDCLPLVADTISLDMLVCLRASKALMKILIEKGDPGSVWTPDTILIFCPQGQILISQGQTLK